MAWRQLSVKSRILLAFSATSTILLAGFYALAVIWYGNNQLERIDSFLTNEASGLELTLSSVFGLAPTAGDSSPGTPQTTAGLAGFLTDHLAQRANRALPYKTTLAILDRQGLVLGQSNRALDILSLPLLVQPATQALDTLTGQNLHYRVARRTILVAGQPAGEIRIGCLINQALETTRIFSFTLLAILVLILVGLVSGSLMLVGLILRPVARMTEAVRQITRSNLHGRVRPIPGKDELANLSVTLNQTLDRLEQTWQSREDFINAMAHQLRTPLAALRGTMELALDKTGDPGQVRQALQEAIQETDNLSRLVTSLLQLARLDNQGPLGQPVRRNLVGLTLAILDELAFLWQEKQVTLVFGLPQPANREALEAEAGQTDSAFLCQVDELQIRQAFLNILDNAARYLPREHGELRVVFSLWHQGQRSFCQVGLENNGPDLQDSETERIFERFQHAGRPSAAQPGGDQTGVPAGFGLGLGIARRIVELQGGRLTAYRPETGGAGFRISLPDLRH